VLLVGDNGAGKTSLLEAIYLAATTRSFRTHQLGVCVRLGASVFFVGAGVGAEPRRELGFALAAGGERTRTLDGKTPPLAEHLAVLPTLSWTQADHELLTGAPALRRRFLDRGLVHLQPGALEAVGRYERALAEKRALLGRGGAGLAPWNTLLARYGAELVAGRAALVSALAAAVESGRRAADAGLAPLELIYRPSPAAALDGPAALEAALAAAAPEERRRGQPLVGPHRDELEVRWGGAPARRIASAGERKALGLLLLAALAGRLADAGREPLLLIDDADAELDRGRLSRLVGCFSAFSQVLFSSSRPEVWPPPERLARARVEGGRLSPVEGP
jgi:DNA replication and repair protein RecF